MIAGTASLIAVSATRVVLSAAYDRSIVAAARACANAGFEVTVTSNAPPAMACASRACHRCAETADPRTDSSGFVASLEAAVERGDQDILMIGNDPALVAVSRHRDRLERHLELALPDHDTVLRCLDKQALAEATIGTTLDSPASVVCSGPDEAEPAARELGFPLVLKSRQSVHAIDGRHDKTASRVAQDEGAFARLAPHFGEELFLQRYVPGSIVSCGGVTTKDRLLALVVSRYERTWPPEGGNVSSSVAIAPPGGLAESIHELLNRLGWEGIFEFELIEREDGSLSAIDLNPRIYGSLGLALGAGVPLPVVWAHWVLRGQAPGEAMVAPGGTRFRWEEAELRHIGRLLLAGRLRDALAVVRPRRFVTHALFEPTDPGPFFVRMAYLAKRFVARLARRSGPGPIAPTTERAPRAGAGAPR